MSRQADCVPQGFSKRLSLQSEGARKHIERENRIAELELLVEQHRIRRDELNSACRLACKEQAYECIAAVKLAAEEREKTAKAEVDAEFESLWHAPIICALKNQPNRQNCRRSTKKASR